MKNKMIIALTLVASISLADTWYTVSTNDDGTVKSKWLTANCNPPHALQDNEYPENYLFPTNQVKFWKKVGNDWAGMTIAEQDAVLDAEADVKATVANWKTNTVDGETLADAFTALVICINKRLPATNKITMAEFKVELKEQLKQ